MAKDKRFIEQFPNGQFGNCYILIDKVTGVNYLAITGLGGGITPLLDAFGKVIVSTLPISE